MNKQTKTKTKTKTKSKTETKAKTTTKKQEKPGKAKKPGTITKGKTTAKKPTGTPTGKRKHPGGRPTVMTPETVRKLEEAFSLGASDEMACKFAGITKPALYDYCKANPKYTDRKEQLKSQLVMKCLYSLNAGIEEDPELALKVLERKSREDFSKTAPEVAVNVSPTTVVAMPEPKGLAALTMKELASIAAEAMKNEEEGDSDSDSDGDGEETEPPEPPPPPPPPPPDHEEPDEPEQGEETEPETDTAAEIEPPEPGEDEWGWA